jgi:hypothetical protein
MIISFFRFLLACIGSIALSLIAHKIIEIPDLYFLFGVFDAVIVMFIMFDIRWKND